MAEIDAQRGSEGDFDIDLLCKLHNTGSLNDDHIIAMIHQIARLQRIVKAARQLMVKLREALKETE